MMYYLNKIVWGMANPYCFALLLTLVALVMVYLNRRRLAIVFLMTMLGWSWFWSSPIIADAFGRNLETIFPPTKVETAPNADAIILLGGGMGSCLKVCPYPNMSAAADRVWHAARLYRAGKAPIVIPTGNGERESSVPLLNDLGVPQAAIVVEDEARNTEENARFVERLLTSKKSDYKSTALLVTSARHMRRALMMYQRYAPKIEVIPVACDYESTIRAGSPRRFSDFMPDFYAITESCEIWKEYVGYWWYRIARK